MKSIELYSSETVPAKKRRWADSWSYAPPSFKYMLLEIGIENILNYSREYTLDCEV